MNKYYRLYKVILGRSYCEPQGELMWLYSPPPSTSSNSGFSPGGANYKGGSSLALTNYALRYNLGLYFSITFSVISLLN